MAAMHLDSEKIIATVETLARRIRERFPNAGLNNVCAQLLSIAQRAGVRAAAIAAPIYWVRVVSMAISLGVIAGFVVTVWSIRLPAQSLTAADGAQILDAGLNALVMIGATIIFLITFEVRIKRHKALAAIHELRVIAHVIDMHQLTKDPEGTKVKGPTTESSPLRKMNSFELNRYLDYCAEMLSLTGKIAALYVQNFTDADAVAAVNDIEDLTSGLARKIWQKIMIIQMANGKESH